jgi:predicted RNA-binding protein
MDQQDRPVLLEHQEQMVLRVQQDQRVLLGQVESTDQQGHRVRMEQVDHLVVV